MSGTSRRLASALQHDLLFDDGELIVREGDDGNEMFVIRSGSVVISRGIGGQESVMAELHKGDFFGEMSVLESLPREATAHAVGPTRLLALGQGALLLRLRQDPSFALEMLNRLSGRIRTLNERLDAAMQERP